MAMHGRNILLYAHCNQHLCLNYYTHAVVQYTWYNDSIATVRDTAASDLSDDDLSVHVVTILNLGPGS